MQVTKRTGRNLNFALLTGWRAQRRRNHGMYDAETLATFAAAWRKSGSAADFLAYTLFRRDLGKMLPLLWVAPLTSSLIDLSYKRRCLALGLIAERAPQVLPGILAEWLADAATVLPALAARFTGTSGSSVLTQVDAKQHEWRVGFTEWLAARRLAGRVCVLGNAAALLGSGMGKAVDACDAVIRFNHFGAGQSLSKDIGNRTDVWVVSPGYKGPTPQDVAWAVMTGPDMRFRQQDWRAVMPLLSRGVPVLTIPLPLWRQLVVSLQAPPSAGVLTLRWLAEMNPVAAWQGICVAGIGTGLTKDGRYHAVLARHIASTRHRWERERILVDLWREQGLSPCEPGLGA